MKDGVILCYLSEVLTRTSLRPLLETDETPKAYSKNMELAIQSISAEHKLPPDCIIVKGETFLFFIN